MLRLEAPKSHMWGRTSVSGFRPWSGPSVPLETVRNSVAPLPPAHVLSANVLPARSPCCATACS